jgi:Domain of unknown function (DUF3391).
VVIGRCARCYGLRRGGRIVKNKASPNGRVFYVGIPFSIYTCWAKQCPTLFIQVLSLMSDNRRTQVITINQLQPGMFVVKLDIPWIDSPFLKHTRLIKSVTEVVKLRESGVKKL